MTPLIEPILELGKLIDRLWAEPEDKAKVQIELLKHSRMAISSSFDTELHLPLAQAQTNTRKRKAGPCLLLDGDRVDGLVHPDYFTRWCFGHC